MKIKFGINKFDKSSVVWDSDSVINGHIIIVGASGTGKTYRIRKTIKEMQEQSKGTRFHILDVHGDIDIPNASEVIFSETSPYGIDLLSISDDEHSGGVRKKINNVISVINRTSQTLGTRQQTVFMNMLRDLYINEGFYPNDSRTWSLDFDPRKNPPKPKQHPTVAMLEKFAYYKLEQMLIGSGSKAIYALEQLNKNIKKLDNILKEGSTESEDIKKLKEECKEVYGIFIDNQTGKELLDMIKYDNKETIKRMYERIGLLESSGIFKSVPPPFEKNKAVWRYNIKHLYKDEQKMFVDIICEKIYSLAKQKGQSNGAIRDVIVIDEAHIFTSEESEHIINVIAKEARKFGVRLMLASQSFTHFPEDIIANTMTKIILGIDEYYHKGSADKLRIKAEKFGYIIPQKTALIQIKNTGDTTNRFQDVIL